MAPWGGYASSRLDHTLEFYEGVAEPAADSITGFSDSDEAGTNGTSLLPVCFEASVQLQRRPFLLIPEPGIKGQKK